MLFFRHFIKYIYVEKIACTISVQWILTNLTHCSNCRPEQKIARQRLTLLDVCNLKFLLFITLPKFSIMQLIPFFLIILWIIAYRSVVGRKELHWSGDNAQYLSKILDCGIIVSHRALQIHQYLVKMGFICVWTTLSAPIILFYIFLTTKSGSTRLVYITWIYLFNLLCSFVRHHLTL